MLGNTLFRTGWWESSNIIHISVVLRAVWGRPTRDKLVLVPALSGLQRNQEMEKKTKNEVYFNIVQNI